MIAPIFSARYDSLTPAVEKAAGKAMKRFAKEVDGQTPAKPSEWHPRKGGVRKQVPVADIRAAAARGLTLREAAEELPLSIEHLRRQSRRFNVEFRKEEKQ